jgi:hypothetical protein
MDLNGAALLGFLLKRHPVPVYSTAPGAVCLSDYGTRDIAVFSRGCDGRFPDAQKIRFRVAHMGPAGRARPAEGIIDLGDPQYFGLTPAGRRFTLFHEAGHWFEDAILMADRTGRRFEDEIASGVWGTPTTDRHGMPTFDGLWGNSHLHEVLADAYAVFYTGPDEMRERWPEPYAFVEKELGTDCRPVEGKYRGCFAGRAARRAPACACPPSIDAIMRSAWHRRMAQGER